MKYLKTSQIEFQKIAEFKINYIFAEAKLNIQKGDEVRIDFIEDPNCIAEAKSSYFEYISGKAKFVDYCNDKIKEHLVIITLDKHIIGHENY